MSTRSTDNYKRCVPLYVKATGRRRGMALWPPGMLEVWANERGAMLIIAFMVLTVLAALGATAMISTTLETSITGYHRASVQAFYAAETGVHIGINQLSANIAASTQAVPVTSLHNSATYQYRSGGRHDAGPQPLQFIDARTRAGYAIGSGTFYNPTGYVFYTYKVNATGMGPRHAHREIEAHAMYGPVAN